MTEEVFENREIRIEKLIVGPFSENCYLVNRKNSKKCFLVDPGYDASKILNGISSLDLEVKYVMVTHGHADHTGAIAHIKRAYNFNIVLGDGDQDLYENPDKWLVDLFPDYELPPKEYLVLPNDTKIEFDGLSINILKTPGHTKGSLCFQLSGFVFTGDTLFKNSIGRYDLPGGDMNEELHSIKTKLLPLENDSIILPGHGDSSTVGHEKINNPYLRDS